MLSSATLTPPKSMLSVLINLIQALPLPTVVMALLQPMVVMAQQQTFRRTTTFKKIASSHMLMLTRSSNRNWRPLTTMPPALNNSTSSTAKLLSTSLLSTMTPRWSTSTRKLMKKRAKKLMPRSNTLALQASSDSLLAALIRLVLSRKPNMEVLNGRIQSSVLKPGP